MNSKELVYHGRERDIRTHSHEDEVECKPRVLGEFSELPRVVVAIEFLRYIQFLNYIAIRHKLCDINARHHEFF